MAKGSKGGWVGVIIFLALVACFVGAVLSGQFDGSSLVK